MNEKLMNNLINISTIVESPCSWDYFLKLFLLEKLEEKYQLWEDQFKRKSTIDCLNKIRAPFAIFILEQSLNKIEPVKDKYPSIIEFILKIINIYKCGIVNEAELQLLNTKSRSFASPGDDCALYALWAATELLWYLKESHWAARIIRAMQVLYEKDYTLFANKILCLLEEHK